MDSKSTLFGAKQNLCFSCLSTNDLIEDAKETQEVLTLFNKTFSLEIEVEDDFAQYICSNCRTKVKNASDFLSQVQDSLRLLAHKKPEEDDQTNSTLDSIDVKSESLQLSPKAEDDPFDYIDNNDTNESNNDSESDNEPLINFVPRSKKKKKKVNTFNPKLKRIPVDLVEEAMEEWRERWKENSNCVLCDFKGMNNRNLSCHMVFKHKEEKNNWCLRCNLILEDLEGHKKTHTNRVWCKFCKKGVTRCHFMEHLKGHAGFDFHCDLCTKKFISQNALNEHLARHKQQKPFQCHMCNKPFKLLKSLEDHILTHGRYRCDVCEKNFEIPELLASHLCTEPADKDEFSFVDEEGETTYTSDGFEVHQEKQPNDDSFLQEIKETLIDVKHENIVKVKPDIQVESLTCHFCQKTYKTAYKLQKHIEAHMGIFLAKCQYCDKGFSCKADLANHERVHTKEKPFICSTCGKGFVSGATLRIHMKQHTGKPEECELCQKRFCRKSELKLHMQKHRGERPFLCTDCGKSFAQKSHLTCHLTMHSEERPYSCSMCDKAFKKKELLKHHEKLHGDKRFKCSVCFYECHKKYRLQQHMKMHEGKSGAKMIPCQLCARTFSNVQLLNVHMGNVHNVVV